MELSGDRGWQKGRAWPAKILYLGKISSNQPANCAQHGATCIDYDPTVPYRFLVGSDQGATFSFSRKAKPGTENILATYSGHFGPVNCVQRNPSYQKIFLTVGDWCARVWSEDAKQIHDRSSPQGTKCRPLTAADAQSARQTSAATPPRPRAVKVPSLPWVSCAALLLPSLTKTLRFSHLRHSLLQPSLT